MSSCILPSLEPAIHEAVSSYLTMKMKSFHCSAHDDAHCFRVARVALRIALDELKREDTERQAEDVDSLLRVVFMAGLFHDMLDSKLQHADSLESTITELKDLLCTETQSLMTMEEFQRFLFVIQSVGYKNTLHKDWNPHTMPLEYRCVQDADLLDAIGSIGIARTFAFTGKRGEALFGINEVSAKEMSEEAAAAYKERSAAGSEKQHEHSCIDHFFEKLLRIRSKISTNLGQQLAIERHKSMTLFLRQLHQELQDAGETSCSDLLRILQSFES